MPCGPSVSLAVPPCLVASATISRRTSSHSPPDLGAANTRSSSAEPVIASITDWTAPEV